MKKLIIALSLTSLATASIQAQGIVNFVNTGGTRLSTNSIANGAATGLTPANATEQFYFALFSSSQNTTVPTASGVVGTNGVYAFNTAGWSFSAAYGTNNVAGRFQSLLVNADGSSTTGISGGSAGYFTIVGWSGNIGSTWQSVQAYIANPTFDAFVGESAVSGSITPGTLGSTPAATLFGATTPFIQGFTLGLVNPAIVPEPATMALAALGGASLLMLRRKK